VVTVILAVAVHAEELPRKSKAPRESYPKVDVMYDSVTMPDGKRKVAGHFSCRWAELRLG
jgi:hypothetical protein